VLLTSEEGKAAMVKAKTVDSGYMSPVGYASHG
jgi:hypothetical protein